MLINYHQVAFPVIDWSDLAADFEVVFVVFIFLRLKMDIYVKCGRKIVISGYSYRKEHEIIKTLFLTSYKRALVVLAVCSPI